MDECRLRDYSENGSCHHLLFLHVLPSDDSLVFEMTLDLHEMRTTVKVRIV